jgi:hypothetical protein
MRIGLVLVCQMDFGAVVISTSEPAFRGHCDYHCPSGPSNKAPPTHKRAAFRVDYWVQERSGITFPPGSSRRGRLKARKTIGQIPELAAQFAKSSSGFVYFVFSNLRQLSRIRHDRC